MSEDTQPARRLDADDIPAAMVLLGFLCLLVGAWLIAPALALLLAGAALLIAGLRAYS